MAVSAREWMDLPTYRRRYSSRAAFWYPWCCAGPMIPDAQMPICPKAVSGVIGNSKPWWTIKDIITKNAASHQVEIVSANWAMVTPKSAHYWVSCIYRSQYTKRDSARWWALQTQLHNILASKNFLVQAWGPTSREHIDPSEPKPNPNNWWTRAPFPRRKLPILYWRVCSLCLIFWFWIFYCCLVYPKGCVQSVYDPWGERGRRRLLA